MADIREDEESSGKDSRFLDTGDVKHMDGEESNLPLVIQCGKCYKILGDTSFLVELDDNTQQLDIIPLKKAIGVVVSADLKFVADGPDMGSTYKSLSCGGCMRSVGKMYEATPPSLDSLRNVFGFDVQQILGYQCGSEDQEISSPTVSDTKQLSFKVLSSQVLKIQSVVLEFNNRLTALENYLEVCGNKENEEEDGESEVKKENSAEENSAEEEESDSEQEEELCTLPEENTKDNHLHGNQIRDNGIHGNHMRDSGNEESSDYIKAENNDNKYLGKRRVTGAKQSSSVQVGTLSSRSNLRMTNHNVTAKKNKRNEKVNASDSHLQDSGVLSNLSASDRNRSRTSFTDGNEDQKISGVSPCKIQPPGGTARSTGQAKSTGNPVLKRRRETEKVNISLKRKRPK